MKRRDDGSDDGDDISAVGEMAESQQPLELLQTDDNGSAGHESNNGRVRQEIHQKSQPGMWQADHGLKKTCSWT